MNMYARLELRMRIFKDQTVAVRSDASEGQVAY